MIIASAAGRFDELVIRCQTLQDFLGSVVLTIASFVGTDHNVGLILIRFFA